MMNSNSDTIILGYDLDLWNERGIKKPICMDISEMANKHINFCGLSGSGKSNMLHLIFSRLVMTMPDAEFYFVDFKFDTNFRYLSNCKRYYSYLEGIEAVDIVYSHMLRRQAGEEELYPIVLIFDEWAAFILALQNSDKKISSSLINKLSSILMLGRNLLITVCTASERSDSCVYSGGARNNYAVSCILGGYIRNTYEMMMPDFIDKIEGRIFHCGEGTVLINGAELYFIKVPLVRNMEKIHELCIRALS